MNIFFHFQVALTFMNMMPKEEVVLALENRMRILKSIVDSMQHLTPIRMKETKAPRHISENFQLQIAHMNAEIDWNRLIIGIRTNINLFLL